MFVLVVRLVNVILIHLEIVEAKLRGEAYSILNGVWQVGWQEVTIRAILRSTLLRLSPNVAKSKVG
jgi:hypothetical protein